MLVLLIAELALRLLPSPTATRLGYYIDPDILTYPPGHQWQMSTGWDLRNSQALVANNLGFPAERNFVFDGQAVALIGDSYVEASMLDAADRPGAQLERSLQGRTVYAMGGPGSSLLDYAERIRYAHQRLGVHDFVVLMEAGDVRQSLCGSGNVHSPCLDRTTLAVQHERREPPSALARVTRESALAQYFVGQLRLSVRALIAQTFRRGVPEAPIAQVPAAAASAAGVAVPAFVDAVADSFFERVRPQVTGRLVMLVDGARDAKRPLESGLAAERRRFIQRARESGAVVVDAEAIFAAHAGRSQRSLDVGPYDGHLNPLGVTLVMTAAAQALR